MPRLKDTTIKKSSHGPRSAASKDLGPTTRAHIRYKIDLDGDGEAEFNVPGVTTITGQLNKPFLVGWANRLGLEGIDSSKYTEEAQKIGSAAHYLIECKLRQEEPDMEDFTLAQITKAGFGVGAFDKWASEHTVKPQILEGIFTSKKYRYGGQLDFYGEVDSVPTLLDFKTSSSLYPEHRLQVAGYWQLLREAGYPVKAVRVLRIGRTEDEGFDEVTFTGVQIVNGWKLFEKLLEFYWLRKELGDK
jgi:hypothetical protein